MVATHETKATGGIAPPRAVFAAVRSPVVVVSAGAPLLHSITVLDFPLPGSLFDFLRFLGLAALLPLFANALVAIISAGVTAEYGQGYRCKHGFHNLASWGWKARPRIPCY